MSESVVIEVNEGKLRGIKEKSIHSGTEYYSFYGVPYAQPPENELRFKDPVKVRPWADVRDATHHKTGCYQFSIKLKAFVGTEDCLYNNIYTPKLPSKGEPLKPTVVNIHPGALLFGSPDPSQYGSPDYVIHHDIVYACVGYRLHVLGFLNLGLEECAGNQGIKDIILGLQWIKQNIHFFGGDPENITLIGSSSGAIMIHLLMVLPAAKVQQSNQSQNKNAMSGDQLCKKYWFTVRWLVVEVMLQFYSTVLPSFVTEELNGNLLSVGAILASRGLFHKAVIMGMYLFVPVVDTQHSHEDMAFRLGYKLGYNGGKNDKRALLEFLKAQDLKEMVNQIRSLRVEKNGSTAPLFPNGIFEPTIDCGKNAILPVPPKTLIPSTSRIPVMFGVCENEAVMGFARGLTKPGTDKHMRTAVRQNINGWMYNLDDDQLKTVYNEIESFYLNGTPIERASLRDQVKIFTDAALSDVYDTLIDLVSADLPSSVFVYKFQFEGVLGNLKDEVEPLLPEPLEGTFHACDFGFWCHIKRDRSAKSNPVETREVQETFTKLISTFAKNGDPNYPGLPVHWRPSTSHKPCYLSINGELEVIDGQLNNERMQFWNNLKKQLMNN